MNKILVKSGLILGTLLVVMTVFVSSCRKEAPTVVEITVIDTGGVTVSNAMVRLYPTPTTEAPGLITVDDTSFTNAAGVATFDFSDSYNLGQAGVFVLDIEVRKEDTLYGEGIIKVEQEETSVETVIVQ